VDIPSLRDSVADILDAETDRTSILPSNGPINWVELWCCQSEFCRSQQDYFRLVIESDCDQCGLPQATWRCSQCDHDNVVSQKNCTLCRKSMSRRQAEAFIVQGWQCSECYSLNAINSKECSNSSCRMPNPTMPILPFMSSRARMMQLGSATGSGEIEDSTSARAVWWSRCRFM
jgi:hypothetical protein